MESPMWGWKTDLYKQQCTLAHSTAEANSKAETEKMSVSYMATSPLSANFPNTFWRTKVQRPVCRRNALLGLGGLCGAAATLGSQSMKALGAPVEPPIPMAETVDFVPPPLDEPLRVRRPAHKLDKEYVAKFKEGIAKMKALAADDPWNFMQQAAVHCADCDGAYEQVGIIGKLIRDPTLALPYWSWGTPEGMRMPKMLFNESAKRPELLMGSPLLLAKSFHQMLLAVLRLYTTLCTCGLGQAQNPTTNFYTTARDIMFFGHHANVDRMWDIYCSIRGHTPEFKQNDWLEASFIFYEENRQVVKCKVVLELNPNLGMIFCLLGLIRDERLVINGFRVDPNPNINSIYLAPQSIET
ncbi:Polyphenol oxidase A1, chloroplastic [Vitis vinifera]|uniref:Polyphenol oxidase A1, chloroplastic n=1 Tax=Vitis vinifera TaxID=29760 RepID=A0A438DM29_VITVI|nr:Polyphenol oxidase A1, chloroplastic [Vitis vinifera]